MIDEQVAAYYIQGGNERKRFLEFDREFVKWKYEKVSPFKGPSIHELLEPQRNSEDE